MQIQQAERHELVTDLRREVALQKDNVRASDTTSFCTSDERFHALITMRGGPHGLRAELPRNKDCMDRFRTCTDIARERFPHYFEPDSVRTESER